MNELGIAINLVNVLLMLLSTIKCNEDLDVYQTPGKLGHYLRMTKHPGKDNFEELSVCLR